MSEAVGVVRQIRGPVVSVEGLEVPKMGALLRLGRSGPSGAGLLGEVIGLREGIALVQVYEDTTGLAAGTPARYLGEPLTVELGPGLLSTVYDGIQRPLKELRDRHGDFVIPASEARPLADRAWEFVPRYGPGDEVGAGDVLGIVEEKPGFEHRILVPPGVWGRLEWISEGEARSEEPVARLESGTPIYLCRRWPVRTGRPHGGKLEAAAPLLTGQRVFDTFFPLAKGGSAIIPGAFGTGKTVTEQTLAKWSDADVIVYVGCGERGNEMAELLSDFPGLVDPRTGRSLLDRTVLVANTSNMPVAAREASIYTGVTIAEYFRDQGYHVALLADSTSRWAEALREVSGRMEELPGEEGFPAYLATRLAAFYERAGLVVCLGRPERRGSVTIVGAVSPPGGDFSEPVTQHSLRVAGCFWSLDADLAHRRHYPAVSWLNSYSLYTRSTDLWMSAAGLGLLPELRDWALALLQEEARLLEVVQLVGPEALPSEQRLALKVAGIIREDYLQQSALDPADAYSTLEKQAAMLQAIRHFHQEAGRAISRGATLKAVMGLPAAGLLAVARNIPNEKSPEELERVRRHISEQLAVLGADDG